VGIRFLVVCGEYARCGPMCMSGLIGLVQMMDQRLITLGNEYHYHVYILQYDATKYSVLYIRRMMDDYLASPVRGHILSLSCPTRISDI
jgi:hypothetical protein